MNFVAIDVETANADMASICSIGAVRFENGQVADEWYSLVDPQDYFDGINISIHGIDETMVRGAPTYAEAAQTLHAMLRDAVTVTHTHFDRSPLTRHRAVGRWLCRSAPGSIQPASPVGLGWNARIGDTALRMSVA